MNIKDSLDRQQTSYNLSTQYYNKDPKYAMQTLYKQQLDSLMHEKQRQKEAERARERAQKKQFNERAFNNKQSQKIKDLAYKNYYNMLLSNQQQLQSSYVSPFSIRDNLKDQHINHSVKQGQKRMKQWQMQERRREMEKKNTYKNELMHQMQQRKRLQQLNKEHEHRQKQQYRKYGKLPNQIEQFQRERKLNQMNKYKQDLDKVKNAKQYFRTRTMSQQQNMKVQNQYHNAIINPLPYNIQNPYILREMNRQSYLAGIANNSQKIQSYQSTQL